MSTILVDGSALLYRSFYAFANRQLQSKSGELTSVSFGVFTSLLKVIREYKPDHLAVVFDVKGKNFRHEIYEDYKANRKPMPDELREQIPQLKDLLGLWGVPVFEKSGFEADDVLATMARLISDKDDVFLYSGDKDFMQLLKSSVSMIKPGKNNQLTEYTVEDVDKDFGLLPTQLIDVFALSGDSSDNIPGAPGVGPKTATKLIQQFGGLNELFEQLDSADLTPRLKRILSENREQILMSRKLFVIDDKVPVDFELDQLKTLLPTNEAVTARLGDLGLRQVLAQTVNVAAELGQEQPVIEEAPEILPVTSEHKVISNANDLTEFVVSLKQANEIAITVVPDGIGFDSAHLAGIAIKGNSGDTAYIPVLEYSEEPQTSLFEVEPVDNLSWIKPILAPLLSLDSLSKSIHNVKDSSWVLARHGLPLAGEIFDTMLSAYVLQSVESDYSVEHLSAVCLSSPIEKLPPRGVKSLPMDTVAKHSCELTVAIDQLSKLFKEQYSSASSQHELLDILETPISAMLYRMEQHGIKLDLDYLSELQGQFTSRIKTLETAIYDLAGEEFNINSSKQLSVILFDKIGLKPVKKIASGWSTDSTVLSALSGQHQLPKLMLEYRGLAKLLNTYVTGLPNQVNNTSGLVHTSFNQAVTATGRLSSSNPNLQNIPIRSEDGKLIRRAFVPRQSGNIFLSADYSQVELRLLAHLSKDERLIETFNVGGDVHRRTAALIADVSEDEVTAEMRSRAKAINFGVIYGMGARALAKQIDVKVREASGFIDEYFVTYPGVKSFIDNTKSEAREARQVSTIMGRVRRLPDITSNNPRLRSFQERVAVNTPIQGSAADLIKLAMLAVDEKISGIDPEVRILLQVHDELLIELPAERADEISVLVREAMEQVIELSVPLIVDIHTGANWAEAHD
ncbi:MAG: DNA polymerase I [bacterium]|nr:DNA polymerase I [bacterium]MCP4800286.1 DNA polymerase I [bacterium]